jgi:hypothetical protein
MNTKNIGELSNISIIRELIKRGIKVSLPIGDNYRYDLLMDMNNKIYRVQCKTGKLYKGSIVFNTCSTYILKGNRIKKHYNGEIEFFAVYFPDNEKVYLVKESNAPKSSGNLRLIPPKIRQKQIKMAENYELDTVLKTL